MAPPLVQDPSSAVALLSLFLLPTMNPSPRTEEPADEDDEDEKRRAGDHRHMAASSVGSSGLQAPQRGWPCAADGGAEQELPSSFGAEPSPMRASMAAGEQRGGSGGWRSTEDAGGGPAEGEGRRKRRPKSRGEGAAADGQKEKERGNIYY
ncbi:hypothetical protein U9M48_026583 [Paspalum notatum var. saurae]|uniref:Uncharacterized protein n=1 Tax=Paspalum notatum var. saurae TaxID=547442 RepID=A0AAQ3TST1_PASNO